MAFIPRNAVDREFLCRSYTTQRTIPKQHLRGGKRILYLSMECVDWLFGYICFFSNESLVSSGICFAVYSMFVTAGLGMNDQFWRVGICMEGECVIRIK